MHATSYHPKGTGKGIVIGEALRYLRTNSDEMNFHQSIAKHKQILKGRGYNPSVTNRLLEPITFDERQTTLVPRPSGPKGANPPLTFVTTYNDAVPQVKRVIHDLWPNLHADGELRPLFPEPPIMALKRNRTVGDMVVKCKSNPIFDPGATPGDASSAFACIASDIVVGQGPPVESHQTTQEASVCVGAEQYSVMTNTTSVGSSVGRACNTQGWANPALYQPRLTRIPLPFLDMEGEVIGTSTPIPNSSQGEGALGVNQPVFYPEPNLTLDGQAPGLYQPSATASQGGGALRLNQPTQYPEPNRSPVGRAPGVRQPNATASQGGWAFRLNQPDLYPEPNLSPEGRALGVYQPNAKASQGKGWTFGLNQPDLYPEPNLTPDGLTLGTYTPRANASQREMIFRIDPPEMTLEPNQCPIGLGWQHANPLWVPFLARIGSLCRWSYPW